ncbi:MAG TPA: glycoside hydrolase family 3 N-terminal domain-containing protein [Candidatus Binatus sp.]|nr:glycoside hydrolase family 3 N-terminal domain-containing protein [Candidatus Binatus sp.]
MTRRGPGLRSSAAQPGGPGGGPLALAGSRLLRTFDGTEPTPAVLAAIARGGASGVTLFRHRNVESPKQLRELADRLQAARPAGDPPLVIGLDQEGGQLQAVGEPATAWPGNLALGAAGSAELAEAAGRAIGLEASAMGATLVFAPVSDVLQPASATPLGTRPFGSDPIAVGRLAAAMVRGLQSAGVAAVLKHFPGHGAAVGDSHLGLPIVLDGADVVRRRDLEPFRRGIEAGAAAVLPGHLAVPALTGGRPIAATVSRDLLVAILRLELSFGGATISDALDMGGAAALGGLETVAVASCAAGMDLLLLVHPPEVEDAVLGALDRAIRSGRIRTSEARAAPSRIRALRSRFGDPAGRPSLDVVGSVAHLDLARRIAEASVTLVRDPAGLLPRRGGADTRASLVAPVPVDLTPAESSSWLRLGLADALREVGYGVDELVMPLDPTPDQVAGLVRDAGRGRPGLSIVATFDAVSHPGQVDLVGALAARGPLVAVALRSPYDVATYPPDVTAICSYGIQAPQMTAVARAVAGDIPFRGRLPVDLAAREPRR